MITSKLIAVISAVQVDVINKKYPLSGFQVTHHDDEIHLHGNAGDWYTLQLAQEAAKLVIDARFALKNNIQVVTNPSNLSNLPHLASESVSPGSVSIPEEQLLRIEAA